MHAHKLKIKAKNIFALEILDFIKFGNDSPKVALDTREWRAHGIPAMASEWLVPNLSLPPGAGADFHRVARLVGAALVIHRIDQVSRRASKRSVACFNRTPQASSFSLSDNEGEGIAIYCLFS